MNLSTTGLSLAADAAIDLHLHTIHSDGTWTPEQLLDYLVGEQFEPGGHHRSRPGGHDHSPAATGAGQTPARARGGRNDRLVAGRNDRPALLWV